jgi:chromosomal replication initiator protein
LYTFNAIASSGNQIVMASDAHPRMVGDLNDQLVNRFVAGMVAKIDPPDQATRMEILHRKARGMKLRASEEVLQYIAMHIRGSVRELEGALIKLKAVAALENGSVSLSVATEAMADHLARTDSAITVGDIEAVVAAYFGITPADIHSTRRTRTVSVARMVAMFLARRHTPMSYPEIGRFMGKNHSSVVLAVQRYESLLADGAEITWPGPLGTKSMPSAKLLEMLSEQFT